MQNTLEVIEDMKDKGLLRDGDYIRLMDACKKDYEMMQTPSEPSYQYFYPEPEPEAVEHTYMTLWSDLSRSWEDLLSTRRRNQNPPEDNVNHQSESNTQHFRPLFHRGSVRLSGSFINPIHLITSSENRNSQLIFGPYFI